MSTKVLLKKSSVAGKVPTPADLSYGEVALNYADGKLYYKDSSNSIKDFSAVPQLSINDLTDVDTTSTTPNVGQVLKWNGTNWVPGDDATVGGTGTDADTLDGFDSSYFLNYNNLSNKPTLFSGSYTDLTNKPVLFSGAYADLTGKPTIPVNTSDLINDAGFITGYTETDPIYTASTWYTTANNSANWDTAYSWGDHSQAGYLLSTGTVDWAQIVNVPTLFSGSYNDLTNKPILVKTAVQWTVNHTLADGTRYLAGDVVYDNGNIFVANFDNESLPTTNTQYWTSLGPGNRLNIDGRDIPNIDYTQLINKPTLFSGSYNDLINTPTFKTINGQSLLGSGDITISGGSGFSGDYNDLTNKPSLFSGSYADLTNKPAFKTILGQSILGSGNLNAFDLNPFNQSLNTTNDARFSYIYPTSGLRIWNGALLLLSNEFGNVGQLAMSQGGNSPAWTDLKTINGQSLLGSGDITITGGSGFSGNYNDLTNKPVIPTVPTNVSAFNNDANYASQAFVTNAVSTKQNTLVSGTNIKTINGQPLLGSGNIVISGGSNSNIIIEDTETLTNSNTAQTVDTYNKTVYRTAKYLLQAINNDEVHATEITLTHNDTNVFINEYGTIYTGVAPLITITAEIDATNVYLKVTPVSNDTVVDFTRISINARTLGQVTFDLEGDLMLQSGSEDLMNGSGTIDLMGESSDIDGDLGSLSGAEDLMNGSGTIDLMGAPISLQGDLTTQTGSEDLLSGTGSADLLT